MHSTAAKGCCIGALRVRLVRVLFDSTEAWFGLGPSRWEDPIWGLRIRTDLSAAELRALVWRETRPRAAPRLYAIAHVLDGLSRADAARLCGVERQACATHYEAKLEGGAAPL